MQYSLSKVSLGLLAVMSLGSCLTSCRKDTGVTSLEGPVPTPGFTVALNTTQYPVVASFTNTTTDGFIYTWDFGDGSKLATGTNVTHTYTGPGTYKVRLTAAGRGGTAITPAQDVVIPTICGNQGFSIIAACGGTGATSWIFSDQPGAIVKTSASGTVLSSSTAPLPACQADDEFSFAGNFSYGYNGHGGTYQNGACGNDLSANTTFVYKPNGSLGQIILQGKGGFIGLPDSVVNKTYDIVEATATRLRLSGTNPDGTRTITTYMPQLSAIDRAKQFLTGGSSRTWVLDNTVGQTIVVGNEANPTGYYAGGALGSLPACQADDEYTFTAANAFIYDAKAETYVGGGVYACQAPRSDQTTFTFGPATGTGLAQFTLNKAGTFIGVTDAPASRVYRILSIDNQNMVLRAGTPTDDPLFTIKMKVK